MNDILTTSISLAGIAINSFYLGKPNNPKAANALHVLAITCFAVVIFIGVLK